MWNTANEDKSNFVANFDDGIKKVIEENGKYAFLGDSKYLEYAVNNNCDLVMVGNTFAMYSFGMAMPKGTYILQ